MRKLLFSIALLLPTLAFSQYYYGTGFFPIYRTFTFDNVDTNFIKIPTSSIWHITKTGKTGLLSGDSSFAIVTDTNNVNVKTGSYYFDIKIPNYMITGDTTHNSNDNYPFFWNYEFTIKHKHNITNSSYGTVFYKSTNLNQFDTLPNSLYWINYCSNPQFSLGNYYDSTFYYYYEGDFSYPDFKFTGIRDTQWIYSIYNYVAPMLVKQPQDCNESTDYNYDTTTFRITYNSPDSLLGGAGWLIKNIKIITYQCTTNCPTNIDKNYIDNLTFNLYPNPASDYLTIDFNNIKSGNYNTTIYNNFGQKVKIPFRKEEYDFKFDVSKLPNGIYQLFIFNKVSSKSSVKRFVVNH
ncbi:MAG: hypothetical protein A2046_13610 [Bacteroidetes bacterium GWA2_30_7]|nr:MAG: hypothetical protein A2046_13610 [Bacteroidetes bacterium GWA2_30_7]